MFTLGDIMDVSELHKKIRSRGISVNTHPDDPSLKILCYTTQTQLGNDWTNETTLCRGLIVRTGDDGEIKDDNVIIARSFKKFFAIEHDRIGELELVDDDEGIVVDRGEGLRMDSPVSVSNKIDGSMGVVYMAPDGLPAIATKATFTYDFAEYATMLLRTKHDAKALGKWMTENLHDENLIVEIVSPRFEHVIEYGDFDDLFLLGSINVGTCEWTPFNEKSPAAVLFGFVTPEHYHAVDLADALELPQYPNEEGIVVTAWNRDGSQNMYKVKYDDYKLLRYELNSSSLGLVYKKLRQLEVNDIAMILNHDCTVNDAVRMMGFEVADKKINDRRVSNIERIIDEVNDIVDGSVMLWDRYYAETPDIKTVAGRIKKENHSRLALSYGSRFLSNGGDAHDARGRITIGAFKEWSRTIRKQG
jgi:RNA ligase